MDKSQRLKIIRDIIASVPIARQEELLKQLSSKGYRVTQASVSRDLDELGITKIGGRYSLPSRPMGNADGPSLDLHFAGENLIVGRCSPGLASAFAVKIDALKLPEIVGTIAGDDTIFIAVRDAADQKSALKKILEVH